MRNIILTASLVTNVFVVGLLYAFTSGQVAKVTVEHDYLTTIDDMVKPVKLSRK